MGYLVGSLAAAAPIPAGLGAVEGGLIGALILYGAPAAPAAGAVLLYRGISLGLAMSMSAGAWSRRRSPSPPAPRPGRIAAPAVAVTASMARRGLPRALGSHKLGNQQADTAAAAAITLDKCKRSPAAGLL